MTSANIAFVTPALIRWARERSGQSRTDIANSLGVTVDEIELWEHGKVHPSFTKAQQLADVCHIPFGYLFLSAPPSTDLPLPDLRTKGTKRRIPSADFADLLNDVLVKQEWYREYREERAAKKLSFVSKFTTSDDITTVAASIAEQLSIDTDLRWQASTWSEYLSLLSKKAEDAGILVMRSSVVANNTTRPLSPEEFQGFSITDELAPLVFVNAKDFKTAQIFTLLHEVTHIWIGKSAIDTPDPVDVESNGDIEGFCNRIASEVLVPHDEFLGMWPKRRNDSTLEVIARHFWVSTLVVLRRALELRQISMAEFMKLREEERRKQTDRTSSGGDYYRNVVARQGASLNECGSRRSHKRQSCLSGCGVAAWNEGTDSRKND